MALPLVAWDSFLHVLYPCTGGHAPMKTTMVATLGVVMALTQFDAVAAPRWAEIYVDSSTVGYVDLSSIARSYADFDGDREVSTASATFMDNMPEYGSDRCARALERAGHACTGPMQSPMLSTQSVEDFDCQRNLIRDVSFTTFLGHMGTGASTVMQGTGRVWQWRHVGAEPRERQDLSIACQGFPDGFTPSTR